MFHTQALWLRTLRFNPLTLGAQGRGSGSGDRERGRDPGATPGAQGRGSGSWKKADSSIML